MNGTKKNHILMSREHLSGPEGDKKFYMIKKGYIYYLSPNLFKERRIWDFRQLINGERHVLYLVNFFRELHKQACQRYQTLMPNIFYFWIISFFVSHQIGYGFNLWLKFNRHLKILVMQISRTGFRTYSSLNYFN